MENTFHDSNVFVVNKIVYFFRAPKRFDVVQLIKPDEKSTFLIKRVIGLPGESIRIQNSTIDITTIKGETFSLEEPYLSSGTLTTMPSHAETTFTVPEDSYFLLGDNRVHSVDSRDFGFVHRRYITGRVFSFR